MVNNFFAWKCCWSTHQPTICNNAERATMSNHQQTWHYSIQMFYASQISVKESTLLHLKNSKRHTIVCKDRYSSLWKRDSNWGWQTIKTNKRTKNILQIHSLGVNAHVYPLTVGFKWPATLQHVQLARLWTSSMCVGCRLHRFHCRVFISALGRLFACMFQVIQNFSNLR